MSKNLRVVIAVVLALCIVLSCTVAAAKLTDPATYGHTLEVLDQNRSTVLGLSAASAAASSAITALPGDIGTPIAEKLSDFSEYFLLILSAVYLEKYLLTILAAAACYFFFPAGLGALLIFLFFPSPLLRNAGTKMVAMGLVVLLVVPTSVWVSDQVNRVYEESIQSTVDSVNELTEELTEEADAESEEDSSLIDRAKQLVSDVSDSVSAGVDEMKNALSQFLEATAVMIVTTCLIPILVILFYGWVIKTLFGVQLPSPSGKLPDLRRRQ